VGAARVLIAGLRGGDGKTLVTVGLQAALHQRGLRVSGFKKGPDYIDAAWSAAALGRPCRNLDLFLMGAEAVLGSFQRAAAGADIAVIEGNRGLYDGVDADGATSTAELAKLLEAPVVLVLDCTKATRTLAASVLGCQRLDEDVPLAGVVLNRVAGARHESVVRAAVRETTGLPVVGVLPRLAGELLPERHLGLVPPAEHESRTGAIREAGRAAARHLDVDAILALARRAPPLVDGPPAAAGAGQALRASGGTVRIGVFRDEAFGFYYPENLEALERAGARLITISPLRATSLPAVDALYLGGGFPETLAADLARNAPFRRAVAEAARAGLPMYAECGGAVYLGESLSYRGGSYQMSGVLPLRFGFAERPQGHGYTELATVAENPFFPVGFELAGHEFHHTFVETAVEEPAFAFQVRRGHGFDGAHDGVCRHNVLATYTHVHALAVERWAPALVAAAARVRAGALTNTAG